MGSMEGEPDERPVHEVYGDAFGIDRYLVTNVDYARFLNVFGNLHSRQFDEKEVNGE
jgi:formylglycine-generating enzyme required for sulfatase activity